MRSKIYKIIIITVIVFSIAGCAFDKKEKSMMPTVFLNPNDTEKDCLLSKIAKDIELISLETNLDCIIGDFSWLVFMDKNNIIYNSDKAVLIFDRKGSFINKIEALGNGPDEYTTITSITVDPILKKILILDHDAIKVYHFNGKFIKSIKLGFSPAGLYRTKTGQNFVSVIQSYNEKNRDMLIMYDTAFKKIKKIKSKNLESFPKFEQNLFISNEPYEVNNEIFYNESYVDTIFKITGSSLKPHWIIDQGNYKMKTTDGVNIDNLHKVYEKDKISLPAIKESQNYFFFKYNYYHSKELCYTVFNKDSNKFILLQKISLTDLKEKGGADFGFRNDLIKNAPAFWPDYLVGDKMVKVLFPYMLTESQRAAFKIKESDNPILMIVTLK